MHFIKVPRLKIHNSHSTMLILMELLNRLKLKIMKLILMHLQLKVKFKKIKQHKVLKRRGLDRNFS